MEPKDPLNTDKPSDKSPIGKERTGPRDKVETETKRKSLKEHKNPVVRALAKVGFWVWVVVMAVGLGLAFIVSLALL